MVGEAKKHALKNIMTNFSPECEKFGILQKLNGRGERIRTSDPLLPKRNAEFLNFLNTIGLG